MLLVTSTNGISLDTKVSKHEQGRLAESQAADSSTTREQENA
jgi:hypothetical protein